MDFINDAAKAVDGALDDAGKAIDGAAKDAEKAAKKAAKAADKALDDAGKVADKALDDAGKAVAEGVNQVAQFTNDSLAKALEKIIGPVLSEKMAPFVAEKVEKTMKEKYSFLEGKDGLHDTCLQASQDAIKPFVNIIVDYCEDFLEDPELAFKQYGVMMLRAVHGACRGAVNAVAKLGAKFCDKVCCCCPCFATFKDKEALIQSIYEECVSTAKETLKEKLGAFGVPDFVIEKMDWTFNDTDEIRPPPSKRKAPKQEEMARE